MADIKAEEPVSEPQEDEARPTDEEGNEEVGFNCKYTSSLG